MYVPERAKYLIFGFSLDFQYISYNSLQMMYVRLPINVTILSVTGQNNYENVRINGSVEFVSVLMPVPDHGPG